VFQPFHIRVVTTQYEPVCIADEDFQSASPMHRTVASRTLNFGHRQQLRSIRSKEEKFQARGGTKNGWTYTILVRLIFLFCQEYRRSFAISPKPQAAQRFLRTW